MKSNASLAGHDNNFNLLRVLAAFAVLYSHSYALTDGKGASEPFRSLLGMSLGGIAVDIFFVISGFLVCGSLLRRQSSVDFLKGRFYRVFPALLVMVTLTVLLLGPLLTRLSIAEYFASKDVFKYFYKNATLLGGVTYKLPGVFESNPYPLAVNGSLWTLPEELRMYGYLLGLWLLLGLLRDRRLLVFRGAVLAVCVVAMVMRLLEVSQGGEGGATLRLLSMFFAGAALQIAARRVPLDWRIFLAMLGGLIAGAAVDSRMFAAAFVLFLPYMVLFLAYVPSGAIRGYNRVGDYSYGLYLYAFPIQQALAALLPGIGLWSMVALATLGTTLCAVASWHMVEKPALARVRTKATRLSSCVQAVLEPASSKGLAR
jgi:peptidoglycan/LPS O-acetylase OafA/YrhL